MTRKHTSSSNDGEKKTVNNADKSDILYQFSPCQKAKNASKVRNETLAAQASVKRAQNSLHSMCLKAEMSKRLTLLQQIAKW